MEVPKPKARHRTVRGPGRRPAGSRKLGCEEIIACGLELSRTIPLQDLSIVRVANELGVTPALIHYYLDGRDALTAGIVNLFFSELMKAWPKPTGKWKPDLEAVAGVIFRHFVRYGGIAAYFAIQNRFKILIGALEKEDSGVLFEFLERYFSVIRAVGLDPDRSATYAALIIQFIHTSAHKTVSQLWPGEQERLRGYLVNLDEAAFPSIAYMRDSYLRLAGSAPFEAGLKLIIAGIQSERRAGKPAQ